MKRNAILAWILYSCFAALTWAQQQKASKPLAGYAAILVEPFAIENSQLTKDFSAGEKANLQLSALVRLRASPIFEAVIDGSQKFSEQPSRSEPSAKGGPRTLILFVTIVGFNKGSSGARFMTRPLPVGVSKAKARFVFSDAANNQEVFRFEKEAKFQATASGGLATKEEQMSHIKGGLVDALLKEIQRNRLTFGGQTEKTVMAKTSLRIRLIVAVWTALLCACCSGCITVPVRVPTKTRFFKRRAEDNVTGATGLEPAAA